MTRYQDWERREQRADRAKALAWACVNLVLGLLLAWLVYR